jgi:hypothetical protein
VAIIWSMKSSRPEGLVEAGGHHVTGVRLGEAQPGACGFGQRPERDPAMTASPMNLSTEPPLRPMTVRRLAPGALDCHPNGRRPEAPPGGRSAAWTTFAVHQG